jgi:putative two-component system response regulator
VEILNDLANNNILEQIPFFYITPNTDDAHIQQAYRLGVMDVLIPPLIPKIVQRRVNSVIELFNTRKQLSNKVNDQQNTIDAQSKQIVQMGVGIIESLATAIEFRSGESGSHVRRIHDITQHMLYHTALGNNLNPEDIQYIALSSILHDVGKIAIPDTILNKPGKLTADEFQIMKTHTTQGGKMLTQIHQMHNLSFFGYAYDIAMYHHERWDGRGYPHALVGNAIPLWAQIVSLADVYDALVSKRVYKEAYTIDHAISMIVHNECGVFNPYLMECFLSQEYAIRPLYENNHNGIVQEDFFAASPSRYFKFC